MPDPVPRPSDRPRLGTGVVSLRQRHGDVILDLDGDAYAWAWTPNIDDPSERLEIDLLGDLALTCHAGRGRIHEPPRPDDPAGTTILVSVHLGSSGSATIAGTPVSEEAIATLAATGLLALIEKGMRADRPSPP